MLRRAKAAVICHDHKEMTGTNKFKFPFTVHAMLEGVETDSLQSIVAWQPHGLSFRIHDIKLFPKVVMPKYFESTKYRSFQRQLLIYGFQRITDKRSPDCGAYFHDLFQRGQSQLCLDMVRQKIKGGCPSLARYKKSMVVAILPTAIMDNDTHGDEEAFDESGGGQGPVPQNAHAVQQSSNTILLEWFEPTPIHPSLDCCLQSRSYCNEKGKLQNGSASFEPIAISLNDLNSDQFYILEDLFG